MAGAFAHRVYAKEETTKEHHSWSAVIAGFHVLICREELDGTLSVDISPEPYDRLRLPLVRFYPKCAADLRALSDELPTLLREATSAMTEALGTDDWRSRWDKMRDEHEETVRRYVAERIAADKQREKAPTTASRKRSARKKR